MQVTSWIVPKPEVNRAAHWHGADWLGIFITTFLLQFRWAAGLSRFKKRLEMSANGMNKRTGGEGGIHSQPYLRVTPFTAVFLY